MASRTSEKKELNISPVIFLTKIHSNEEVSQSIKLTDIRYKNLSIFFESVKLMKDKESLNLQTKRLRRNNN